MNYVNFMNFCVRSLPDVLALCSVPISRALSRYQRTAFRTCAATRQQPVCHSATDAVSTRHDSRPLWLETQQGVQQCIQAQLIP